MLKIDNLTVKVLDKTILEKFNLEINDGEIHVLMGPNGAGKSTISKVIMRDLNYEIIKGSITYNDKDLLKMNTTEVAREKISLISQSPMEIEGVTNAEMLRTVLNDLNEMPENVLEFNRNLVKICQKLNIPESFIHRDINYNMSGGEKKKNELMHLFVLQPKLVILDEIDSGLDIDALNLVANSLKEYYEENHPSMLIITHQPKLLEILKPDYVHVLKGGKIVQSGDYNLALEIFKNGFGASIMSRNDLHE